MASTLNPSSSLIKRLWCIFELHHGKGCCMNCKGLYKTAYLSRTLSVCLIKEQGRKVLTRFSRSLGSSESSRVAQPISPSSHGVDYLVKQPFVDINPSSAKENSRADDNLFLFLIFQRKSCLTLHVNRLLGRRFTCDVKHYFLWKIQKNILWKCRLPVVIGALRVKTQSRNTVNLLYTGKGYILAKDITTNLIITTWL